ncbi:MAG: hypothetical protein DRN31_00075, partial [Thermoplasmata archaeon]
NKKGKIFFVTYQFTVYSEEVDAPLGIDGKLICDEKYLSLLVSIANEIMDRIEKKLKVFERKIEELG